MKAGEARKTVEDTERAERAERDAQERAAGPAGRKAAKEWVEDFLNRVGKAIAEAVSEKRFTVRVGIDNASGDTTSTYSIAFHKELARLLTERLSKDGYTVEYDRQYYDRVSAYEEPYAGSYSHTLIVSW